MAYTLYGASWARISRELPGRTDNAVRNHWHSSLRVRYTKVLKSVLENPTVEDLQIKASLGVKDEMLIQEISGTGTIGVRSMCRWALDLTENMAKNNNLKEERNGGEGTNVHFQERISGYFGEKSNSHSGEETNGYFGGGTNGLLFDEENNEFSGEEISGYYEEPKRVVCQTEGFVHDLIKYSDNLDELKESPAVVMDDIGEKLHLRSDSFEIPENPTFNILGIPRNNIREIYKTANSENKLKEVAHLEDFFKNLHTKTDEEISMLQNEILWSLQNNGKLQISNETNFEMKNVEGQTNIEQIDLGEETNHGMEVGKASLADVTEILGLDESDTCLSIPNSDACRMPSNKDTSVSIPNMDLVEMGPYPLLYIQ